VGRQRLAISIAFLAFGAASGSWVPRLPAIKDQLHLTDGQVGFALLAFAVGAVTGSALARTVLARGARRFVRVGTVALCAALIGPGLATGLSALIASLLVLGTIAGFLDVLENAQAAELERDSNRPLINSFHGFWSLGAIVGSVTAGAAAFAGVAPLPQFIIAAVLIAAGSAAFLRGMPDTRSGATHPEAQTAGRLRWTGSVAAVAAIALCGILVEGGASDWSALYLRELSHASQGVAAAGFACFWAAATVVRFRADILTAYTSPAAVARLGASVAALGIAVAIAFPALPGALIGFTLAGVGTAVLVPLAFSAAANLGQSGTALSLVTSSGYAGSIIGPALIGAAADRAGLRFAISIPLIAAMVVMILAGSLRGPSNGGRATSPRRNGKSSG
jgi:fucose permease